MSAWTNGKVHVIAGPRGVSVHRQGEVSLVLGTAQLGGEMPAKKGKTGFARLRPVAVGWGAKVVYTVGCERNLVRAEIGAQGRGVLYPYQVSALAPAEGDRVLAAYVTGTKARALTSIVIGTPPADPKGKWEREFEADRPGKVDWPDELLWDKAPWSRKTRWATDPDLLHIDANAHGYVVYDTASAVVGLLRKGADKFSCVLRTPQDKGSSLAATASEQGLLVATCKGDGAAALCHFDPEGKLLAHREFRAREVGPMTLAGGQILAVVDGARVQIFALDDLAPVAELALPTGPASQMTLRQAADGVSFMLARADRIFHGLLVGGAWSLTEFDLADVPEPTPAHEAEIREAEIEQPPEPAAARAADTGPRIITQAPRLDMNPQQPNEAWHFAMGEAFELVIMAVSVGGPAERGLYVEVDGDALAQGLVEVGEAVVLGTRELSAPFVTVGKRRVAKLDYLMPAGIEPNKEKKIKPKDRFLENPEDTFLTVTVRGVAKKLGNALLYVRVGFEGEQDGSLMRGRPVTISEFPPSPPSPPSSEP